MPWCVGWYARDERGLPAGPVQYCAAKGPKPADHAGSVATRCGFFVNLPCGTVWREPTCAECLKMKTSTSRMKKAMEQI